tara:strand:+ start:3571 stop:3993 length:423 start_codon:yes stop_codon:yes gene_type:complete
MASVKGVNFTNITSTPVVNTASKEAYGKLRVTYDTYEASSLASGSDISVARLPQGATVYDIVIHHDALGSGVTLAVGDSADADRYITATAAATAGKVVMSEDGAIDGFAYEQTAETDVLITTGGAAATGTIKVAVIYSVE